ncbi:MAG: hypothetical protein A2527_03625 [Candidatus Lambdaproteobacteria bacterium RIFOXYD2_FULL_50_16]|uniref:Major facilitator superfamily (MFS) profile domain-containing protein n=1 Tax=Candidatus Lambdaproteobacteria bacterium RIFOXYD2_FULL_50_16 TaxID=1817772 RepID=A0A1F6GEZ3_9PROT|nr:MAG: hypothetical protein A2527_03625 [Candidatus Lambdaproteobacteria bacterium RIFOXYD2_FULL_50_16]
MKGVNQNTLRLALALALAVTSNILSFSVALLAAEAMIPGSPWVSLPLFLQYGVATLVSLPSSMLMKKLGRKRVFMLDLAATATFALIATQGVLSGNFALFCLGSAGIGLANGIRPYYRFAALEAAGAGHGPRAMALVLAGGVLAAVAGPNLGYFARAALSVPYAGNYLLIALLQGLGIWVIARVRLEPVPALAEKGRSLYVIAKQPRFILALLGGMISYAVMSGLMVATAPAMTDCGYSFWDVSQVIQWHVLAMYAPSFFSGPLLARLGVYPVLLLGAILNAGAIGINLNGQSASHFYGALILLGLGWNFLYLGASQLLTRCYRPEEMAKVQGVNELVALAMVSTASLGAGWAYRTLGWEGLNWALTPALVLVTVLTLVLLKLDRH